MGYLFILGTIAFTVYGQLVLKWRIGRYGPLPPDLWEKSIFFLKILLDPFILSGFFSAFVASLCWMATLTKFDLSFAYPFMSTSFIVVFIISAIFFKEPVTTYKAVGLLLIALGIFVTSRST